MALPNLSGTPYAGQQNAAHLAYNNALAQIGTQRNQYMQQMGFDPSTGQMAYNPLSQWGQLSGSLERGADVADSNIANRGLGSIRGMGGVGMQNEENANMARDSSLQNFTNSYQQGLQGFDQSKLNAQQTYNQATTANQQHLIEWLIKTGQFNTPKRGGK